ncbi:MAG TPA: hypothetical protein VGK23_05565 [Methanomassiliicoccales archaeon]|jgi:hypothetical protein
MTTDDDVKVLAERRVDHLRRKHRDISLDYVLQHSTCGDWVIILYAEYDFILTGFDIIESRTSWKRPDAVEMYNALVDEGYCVVVYVPDDVRDHVIKRIKEMGGRENIRVSSMNKLLPMVVE